MDAIPPKTDKDLWVEMSIREISTQADFAGIAYAQLDPKARNSNAALFSSIHSFLSHCAMVSKMLVAKDDGRPRRSVGSVLKVSASSLIHERTFRHHLEHYDERLKQWTRKHGVNSLIGDYNIGPKSALAGQNMIHVRYYEPDTQVFTFLNNDFDLGEMAEEVRRIKNLADQWIMKVEAKEIMPPFV